MTFWFLCGSEITKIMLTLVNQESCYSIHWWFLLNGRRTGNVSWVCCLLVSVCVLSPTLTHSVVLGETKRQQPRELAFGGRKWQFHFLFVKKWKIKTKYIKNFTFLLQFRGNAGSHDLPFSIETLTELSKLTKEGEFTFLACATFSFRCCIYTLN